MLQEEQAQYGSYEKELRQNLCQFVFSTTEHVHSIDRTAPLCSFPELRGAIQRGKWVCGFQEYL